MVKIFRIPLKVRGVAVFICVLLGSVIFLAKAGKANAGILLQQPTVSVPTVTGTPVGPTVTVPQNEDFVYVHSGPGPVPDYPNIGILVTGQVASALGVSGDYIMIAYLGVPGNTGWVHHSLVTLKGTLPMVTPPPKPTSQVTPTLNPTLEAEYAVEVSPTPLPTYTSPPPLRLPTFAPEQPSFTAGNFPFGFIIIGMAVVGIFGALITLLRGR